MIWQRKQYKREFSIDIIEGGERYPYPEWYYTSKDEAAKKRICLTCGKPLVKGQKLYCDDIHCKGEATVKSLGFSSVRREIHKKFGFACTRCGIMFFKTTDGGVQVPLFGGHCHHVIPLEYGGKDTFDNQTLLCGDCHKEVHNELRVERKILNITP